MSTPNKDYRNILLFCIFFCVSLPPAPIDVGDLFNAIFWKQVAISPEGESKASVICNSNFKYLYYPDLTHFKSWFIDGLEAICLSI